MKIVKAGRIALGFALNLLAVWIGVAIVSSALGRSLWHPHTTQAILRISYSYDVFAALLLGFIVYRRFRSETSKWVCIVTAVWFLFRAAMLLKSPFSLWSHMSGSGLHQRDARR